MSATLPTAGAPQHAEGLVLRQAGELMELVDRQGRTIHTLNSTALALWELCDGETTAEEMTVAAMALFDADARTVEHDIASTLDSLTRAGLLLWPTTAHDGQGA